MYNIFKDVCKGDVVIDCGAYVGKISNYFADKKAIVYAMEPFPLLWGKLSDRFESYHNVHVVQQGAYDRNCMLKMYYHEDYNRVSKDRKIKYLESSSVFSSKSNVSSDYLAARFVDISEFVKTLNCDIKILKLNVEGAEYKILDRLIETGIIYKIESVVVAFHNKSIPTLQSAHDKLKEKVISKGLYGTIVKWKWWNNNKQFLNKVRKEYS